MSHHDSSRIYEISTAVADIQSEMRSIGREVGRVLRLLGDLTKTNKELEVKIAEATTSRLEIAVRSDPSTRIIRGDEG